MARSLLLLALTIGCGGGAPALPTKIQPTRGNAITLYRDRAVVRQELRVTGRAGEVRTLTISLPRSVVPDEVVVLERTGVVVKALRGIAVPDEADARASVELTLAFQQPEATIVYGYAMPGVTWDATYTLTTTAARQRATLEGTLAIANSSDLQLLRARMRVRDAELGSELPRSPKGFATALGDAAAPAPLRDLGIVDLRAGERRMTLVAAAPPTPIRTVLVYDPIGTRLDRPGAAPDRDPAVGLVKPSPLVMESYEVVRAPDTLGLPGGTGRLVERKPDGSLAVVVAKTRLFDEATRVATVDTIALGPATDVTGHRERRELTLDEDGQRVTEDFLITIENARTTPVEVVLREHLYRGQNWNLAYFSTPLVAKEGPQQISLRTQVPARGRASVLYTVVYTNPDTP